MEASRIPAAVPTPQDDPVELAAHRDALDALVKELESELSEAELAGAAEREAALLRRAEHWPE